MHPYHLEIKAAIEELAAKGHAPLDENGSRYIGSTKPVYFIRAADLRKLFGEFPRNHPDLSTAEFVSLLDSLSQGKTYNEFAAVGLLLNACPEQRRAIDPYCLDRWLNYAEGWAEVDVICQLSFTAKEMLAKWETWQALLSGFAESEAVQERRASLVLLTKPLRETGDQRLADLAFANVEKLKGEKSILITKAVSWILRSLIKYHRVEVEKYLDANMNSLPKIAIRETRNKLAGGVKAKRTNS